MFTRIVTKSILPKSRYLLSSFSTSTVFSHNVLRSVNTVPKNTITRTVPTICQYAHGRYFASISLNDIWPDHQEMNDNQDQIALYCLDQLGLTYEKNKKKHYYDNGLCYEGDLKDNLWNGHGILYRYDDKELQFNEDVAKIIDATKDIDPKFVEKVFKEELKKQAHKGIINNMVYEGQFKKGKKDGYGTEYLDNGVKYTGDFENDKKEGLGSFYYLDGSKLKCAMHNDKANGKGTIYNSDGTIRYEGDFKDDEPCGQGIYYLPTGGVYKGEMKHGKMDGLGKLDSEGVSMYEGEFKDNKMNGHGKYYVKNRLVYDGEYKQNLITGYGTYYYEDGSIYEGDLVNGLRHGNGHFVFELGMYQGSFHNNLQHGHGILFNEDGSYYEGEFYEGCRHGPGKQYNEQGQCISELVFEKGHIVKSTSH